MTDKQKLSTGTIHNATILQAIADISPTGFADKEDIKTILQPPEGYPISTAYNNLRTKSIIEVKKKGRTASHYKLTKKGKDYLKLNHEYVQKYGHYELVYTDGTPRKSGKKKSQVEQPAITFSPAVQAAMAELENVAIYNDQAKQCLDNIHQEIARFRLKEMNTDLELSGTLNTVQLETKVFVDAINEIEESLEILLN